MSTVEIDRSVGEIIRLLETDSMPRYKEKIRKQGTWFADHVWKDEKLGNSSMTPAQFRTWAEKNPGAFSFLEDLQLALRNAENRQKSMATVRLQRWWRSILSKDMDLASVVEKVRRHTDMAQDLVVVPLSE